MFPISTKILIAIVLLFALPARAETPEEWIALGARVHGAFGAFIPVGIRIGLDAVKRLDAKPRELTVLYYDSERSPCACFADGIAIATFASVGQRTLIVAPEKAPEGAVAIAIIRPRRGGPGFKYTIPASALAKLGPMNKNLTRTSVMMQSWPPRIYLRSIRSSKRAFFGGSNETA